MNKTIRANVNNLWSEDRVMQNRAFLHSQSHRQIRGQSYDVG
jgi:hypothetical protein